MIKPENILALIVAAGSSTRMGSDINKPYVQLNGIPLLRYSVETFLRHPEIAGVRVVIRREDHAEYKRAVDGLTLCPCVVGGATRQASVLLGLEALQQHAPTHVLIHDAARPLVTPDVITRVVEGLRHAQACFPALPLADSIKSTNGYANVDRHTLLAAQTPQGFSYSDILAAHRDSTHDVTDDIALAQHAGLTIHAVAGEPRNFKITTPDNLTLAAAYISL